MSALSEQKNYVELLINDTLYKLGKLTVGDIIDITAIMTERLRNRRIELLKKLYPDSIPDSQIDGILRINFDIDELEKHLEAVGLILWRSLQRYQPSMKESEAVNLLTVENCTQIIEKLVPSAIGKKKQRSKASAT